MNRDELGASATAAPACIGGSSRRINQALAVAVNGPVTVDDPDAMLQAAIAGVGLAFTLEAHAAPALASGALVRVLEDWCPPLMGFPVLPQPATAARHADALIDMLRVGAVRVGHARRAGGARRCRRRCQHAAGRRAARGARRSAGSRVD